MKNIWLSILARTVIAALLCVVFVFVILRPILSGDLRSEAYQAIGGWLLFGIIGGPLSYWLFELLCQILKSVWRKAGGKEPQRWIVPIIAAAVLAVLFMLAVIVVADTGFFEMVAVGLMPATIGLVGFWLRPTLGPRPQVGRAANASFANDANLKVGGVIEDD